MAIQDSDLLLINRAGASYKVAASNLASKVQAGDLALVNRSGSSYKLTGDKLTAGTFDDTDLFIVNRAGASYQVAGSEIKTLLIQPVPSLEDATWAFVDKNTNGSNFRLTITFSDGATLNLSTPTEVRLGLVCLKVSTSTFANLINPVTSVGGPVYQADLWSNSNIAQNVFISPDFTSISGGNKLTFDLFIPNSISIVTIGSITTSAKASPINGRWDGNVGVYQNNVGNNIQFTRFTADNDYFN